MYFFFKREHFTYTASTLSKRYININSNAVKPTARKHKNSTSVSRSSGWDARNLSAIPSKH